MFSFVRLLLAEAHAPYLCLPFGIFIGAHRLLIRFLPLAADIDRVLEFVCKASDREMEFYFYLLSFVFRWLLASRF